MIKILPLGGIGHVTNNLFVYEYYSSNRVERLIVDCGIGFPEETMLGADLLLPDISYLKDQEDTIVGICLTHGHDDHIAGLPYIIPQLGLDIPIYASKLTAGFAQANLKDFGVNKKINEYPREPLKLGSFTIDPVYVTHSVPDSRHLAITTPDGTIYHGSDFKFDWTPVDGIRSDILKMANYGRQGVLALLTDCLRVENDGYSLSETKVGENLSREIREVEGKVIVTTMSSNIHRIQQAVDAAVEHGRHISFIGRSVEENIKIAQSLGFIHIPEKMIVNKKRISKYPDKFLCLIVAGSQGQVGSTLTRIAQGEHQIVTLKKGDHVIFSADPIPGNEQNVYAVIDELAKTGATVSYREIQDTMHVSGHASAEELRLLLSLINPKFILPIGGTFRHMNQFKVLASQMGWGDEKVLLPDDGDVMALTPTSFYIDNKVKLKTVIVDGLGIGDVGPLVLQDRKKMAKSGMVVVAIPVDKDTLQVISRPEVITRGFVFVRGSKVLIEEMTDFIAQMLPEGTMLADWQDSKDNLEKGLSHFIMEKTQREPLILGVMVKS